MVPPRAARGSDPLRRALSARDRAARERPGARRPGRVERVRAAGQGDRRPGLARGGTRGPPPTERGRALTRRAALSVKLRGGAGMPWPHRDLHGHRYASTVGVAPGDGDENLRAWVDPMERTFHTRENARPGRDPHRPSTGSPPVRRPSVALRARAPTGYSSDRDPPDVVRGTSKRHAAARAA